MLRPEVRSGRLATNFRLVIQDDEGETVVYPVDRTEISIGRMEGNDIRLEERNVSRRHARIFRRGLNLLVEDLDSYNGVLLNGSRIQAPTPLTERDRVWIGPFTITAEREDCADAETDPGRLDGMMPALSTDVTEVLNAELPTPSSQPTHVPPVANQPRLICVGGPHAGHVLSLSENQMVLGRIDENDLVLDDPSVSRHHARLTRTTEGIWIEDLDSVNGLLVNGESQVRCQLREADVVELGEVPLRFVPAGRPFQVSASEAEQMQQAGLDSVSLDPTHVDPAAVSTVSDSQEDWEHPTPPPLMDSSSQPTDPELTPSSSRTAPAALPKLVSTKDLIDASRGWEKPRSDARRDLMLYLLVGFVTLAVTVVAVAVVRGLGPSADAGLEQMYADREDQALLERYDADPTAFGPASRELRNKAARRLATRLGEEGSRAFRAGRYEEAIRLLEDCVERDPNVSLCHRNLAVAYGKLERSSEAAEHFRTFLRLEPDHPEADHIRRLLDGLTKGPEVRP
ncbi:MAG: FHA domain-containing protein [Myxococcota bacterium]